MTVLNRYCTRYALETKAVHRTLINILISKLNFGLLAQEELEVEKEHGFANNKDDMLITSEDEGGNYGMKYERIVPILINAVKELSAKVEELESKLN